jgi:hypothetical protein
MNYTLEIMRPEKYNPFAFKIGGLPYLPGAAGGSIIIMGFWKEDGERRGTSFPPPVAPFARTLSRDGQSI